MEGGSYIHFAVQHTTVARICGCMPGGVYNKVYVESDPLPSPVGTAKAPQGGNSQHTQEGERLIPRQHK